MIHLLGVGSIGSLIAHTIRKQNYPITVLLRTSRLRSENSRDYAITVASKFHGQEKVEKSNGYELEASDSDTIGAGQSIRLLVVCTKAFSIADAIRPLRKRFDRNTVLVVLHNGVGVREELHVLFSEGRSMPSMPPLIEGFLSHGAYAIQDNSIMHAGQGDFYLSSSSDNIRTRESLILLKRLLAELQVSEVPYHNFQYKQFQKLLVNVVINPITAIQNHKNGRTGEYPHLIRALLVESLSVLRVAHPELSFDLEDIGQVVNLVIARTAENKSSMLQDLLAGRKTEIDFINGAICALARKHQIGAPINTALVRLVKKKEVSRNISGEWADLLQAVCSEDKHLPYDLEL